MGQNFGTAADSVSPSGPEVVGDATGCYLEKAKVRRGTTQPWRDEKDVHCGLFGEMTRRLCVAHEVKNSAPPPDPIGPMILSVGSWDGNDRETTDVDAIAEDYP